MKDNVKLRMGVADICDTEELYLQPGPSGKTIKPKVKLILVINKTKELCEWVKGLNEPYGYYSSSRNIVDPNDAKFNNIKFHDCLVFIETLLRIAFGALLDNVLKPLIEIS